MSESAQHFRFDRKGIVAGTPVPRPIDRENMKAPVIGKMMSSNRLDGTLRSMLPPDIASAGGDLHLYAEELFEVERKAIQGAANRRRREFVAGRSYARAALTMLGCRPQPLPVGPTREVIWPSGFVGSISHSGTGCAAIVARADNYCGVGLDLESDDPIEDEDVCAMICRPEERAIVCGQVDLPKLLFVIKEAVFKAYYPCARYYLEFAHLSIELDSPRHSFQAQLVHREAPSCVGNRNFVGAFGLCDGHVIATVAIRTQQRF